MRYGEKFGELYGDGWIKAIFDRTLQDISKRTAKGYLNAEDLNRIEMDLQYLSDRLNGYGYNQKISNKTDWDMPDFPYMEPLERIRTNIATLVEVYYPQSVNVPISLNKPTHRTINNAERILHEMRQMIMLMRQSFKRSGTFYCGQTISF